MPKKHEAPAADLLTLLKEVARLPERERQILDNAMPVRVRRRIDEHWRSWAHDGQYPDASDWRVWMIMAGRGFGKTRAGSEWVSDIARANPSARIALVGATVDDVRKVMVEGQSGILTVAKVGEELHWNAGRGELVFRSGAIAHVYSAEAFEKLRGPQHSHAWCDEVAKWAHASECWHNLLLGLREGEKPRVLVTTTPRPVAVIRV